MPISIAHISWFLSHPCTYGELHYYYCYMFMPTLWLDWHPKMLNRLWLGDVIWRHRSRSTLAQVMAWCHQVPRHSLMSTYHQVWTVAFIWDQITRKKWWYLKWYHVDILISNLFTVRRNSTVCFEMKLDSKTPCITPGSNSPAVDYSLFIYLKTILHNMVLPLNI